MIYDTPSKGEDGLYFVKATNDDKKKCFVQVNRVGNVSLSGENTEVTLNLLTENNVKKITDVDELNITAAVENAASWFGKNLTEDVIRAAYTSSLVNDQFTCERIVQTRVFNSNLEVVDISTVTPENTCTAVLEFAGLWFAKKAFGPVWNLVQVKVFDDPVVEEAYPEDYIIRDEDEQ
jgi:hypothetical protein